MATAGAVVSLERTSLLHIARSTVAALASQLSATGLHMPEPYWATVTTIVVMLSFLGAAWTVSWKREPVRHWEQSGGLLASYFGGNPFGVALVGSGLVRLALKLDRAAYRFAGITVTIIMLVARTQSAWIIAIHRFVEVTLGIAVGLVVTGVWPEKFHS